jgi:hypothetical protein
MHSKNVMTCPWGTAFREDNLCASSRHREQLDKVGLGLVYVNGLGLHGVSSASMTQILGQKQ